MDGAAAAIAAAGEAAAVPGHEGDALDGFDTNKSPESPTTLFAKAVQDAFRAAPEGESPCVAYMDEAFQQGRSVADAAGTYLPSGMESHHKVMHRKLLPNKHKGFQCPTCRNVFKSKSTKREHQQQQKH